jgi:hypothetical protein
VYEPGISPAWTGFLLFYAKRLVTRFISRRVQLFDKWNNIGAPVISYLTSGQLTKLVEDAWGGGALIDRRVESMHVNLLWRACGITRRTNTTLILRRVGKNDEAAGGIWLK